MRTCKGDELARNLEARFYSDPDIFQAERENIFRRSWQLVGAASAIAEPGKYLSTELAGYQVFTRRGEDGALRAFENVCPHRGSRILPHGVGECPTLQCPYHGWRFHSDGKLAETPWFGEESPFDLEGLALPEIAVAEWRGLIFLAIAPQVELSDQLGALVQETAFAPLERYAFATERRYDAAVNWKAYLDQFQEFYHAPIVHGPDKAVAIHDYDVVSLPGMMRMTSPQGHGEDAAYYGGRWMWGWPNWTISFFPGGMKTSRIDPIGPAHCRTHFQFYFDTMEALTEAARGRVIAATGDIFAEDVRAAERVQVNYSSGAYRPGPLHPRLERAVAYFQARVRGAIDGDADAAAVL